MTRRLPALWIVLSAALAAPELAADPPRIDRVVPLAVAPGAEVELELEGTHLQDITELWTSFPSRGQRVPDPRGDDPRRARFRLYVPPEVEVGVGALRAIGRGGISNLRLYLVDDLSSLPGAGGNHSPETARKVSPPVAIDAMCEELELDYYAFEAAAGERVSVEVVAQRIGSAIDPVVRLLDRSGRELEWCDDAAGLDGDASLAHRFEEPGDYLLELRDITYRGGGAFHYRLRIGDFPLASAAHPLGGKAGAELEVAPIGPGVAGVAPRRIELPCGDAPRSVPLGFRSHPGRGSAFARILSSPLAQVLETEPNDSPADAALLHVPGAASGRFHAPRDRDVYRLEVTGGEALAIHGISHRLGSATDLLLSLVDGNGARLAEAALAGTDERLLEHTFSGAGAGAAFLVVEELHGNGGQEHAYRVEVRRAPPAFTLAAGAESVNVPPGGSVELEVKCERRGYDGAVALALECKEPGLRLEGGTIPAKKGEGKVRILASEALEPGTMVRARLTGTATAGNARPAVTASTRDALRALFPGTRFPPLELDGVLAIGIEPPLPDFFAIETTPEQVVVPRFGRASRLEVRVRRLDEAFRGPVDLKLEGLPAGVQADVAPVAAGENSAAIPFTANEEAASGSYRVRLRAGAELDGRKQAVVLDEIPLAVVDPLALTLVPGGPIPRGGNGTIKVIAEWRGAGPAPIQVRWTRVPDGVELPQEAVLDAGKTEVSVEVGAGPATLPGTFLELVAEAEATVGGRRIVVESRAAIVEIARDAP